MGGTTSALVPIPEPVVTPPNGGIPNLGNSCYINCVMQLYLHAPELYEALCYVTGHPFGSSQSHALLQVIYTLRQKYCESSKINLYEQCDATFFMNFTLDLIASHADTKHVADRWKQKWRNNYTCRRCRTCSTSDSAEEHMYILYPVKESSPSHQVAEDEELVVVDEFDREFDYDMGTCIEAQRSQMIHKYCERCQTNTPHSLLYDLTNLPQHLFINYHHFTNKLVLVYPELNLSSNNHTQSAVYQLKGFVCHQGTAQAGHYLFYGCDRDGKWFQYNDSVVTYVPNISDVLCYKLLNQSFPFMWYANVTTATPKSDAEDYGEKRENKRIRIGGDEDVDMSSAYDFI